MAREMDWNTLGVFDIGNAVFTCLSLEGRMWVDTGTEYEVLGDRIAFRYAPLREKVSAHFTLSPTEDTGPVDLILVIPLTSYTHSLPDPIKQ